MSVKINKIRTKENFIPDTYAEINLSALKNNFEAIKKTVNRQKSDTE